MKTTAHEIYDRVRDEVNIPLDDEETYTPRAFLNHINRAVGIIASKGAVHHTELTIPISQDTRYYNVPGIKMVIAAWLDGHQWNLLPAPQQVMANDRTTEGKPLYYSEVNEGVMLHPSPTQPDTLRVYGAFTPAKLQSLDNVVQLEDDYCQAIDYWVLGHWHLKEGNAPESSAYLGMWSELIKGVRDIEVTRLARSLPNHITNNFDRGEQNPHFFDMRKRR